jgi:hypothetical protein
MIRDRAQFPMADLTNAMIANHLPQLPRAKEINQCRSTP